MNSSSFDRVLRQVLVVPVVIMLLGAVFLTWQIQQAYRTVAQQQASDEAIAHNEVLLTLIIDQETGLRGYQTTADPQFLQPYKEAVPRIARQFDTLRAAAPDPQQRAFVVELQTAYDAWKLGFADPLIASIAAGGQTSDVELNLLGKRRMDNIRGISTALGATARTRRDDYIARWRRQVRLLSSALVVIAIILGLVIGLFTRRQLQQVSLAFHQSHDILRLRAEQAFLSEQKLRATLQSIADGVITCSAQGSVETMNTVAQDLTGWDEQQARGLPIATVFHILDRETRQPLENPVASVLHQNRVVTLSGRTILRRKDMSEIFIDDSAAPIRDKPGNVTGAVLVFRDITLALKSQEALLANEKLAVAGRLAATIAHEIHNPLDSVANLLFLMQGNTSPEETSHFLDLARQELARVTQISRAMLALYRESKAPVPIDLTEIFASILLLMERRLNTLGVTATTSLPPQLIVHGFPAELRQVFTNLITNAAEASAAGGIIHIAASPRPGFDPAGRRQEAGVLITIADTGPGIPADILTTLFQPFVTTKGEQGTGLGLWISRGIITRHGGTLDLTSSTHPEHHGTTATLFLATTPTIAPGGD